MRTIAILCGRYLPGYKDGGPVRTLINLINCLGKEYNFIIITNDRDHGDNEPYKGIKYTEPNKVAHATVWYLKPNGFTFTTIRKLTRNADLIYVCGPYDDYAYKALILKRIGKISQPVVVAAMGSFSEGAYGIKNHKKTIYINLCKLIGLFKNMIWSVTSEIEKEDVLRVLGKNAQCIIAEDLPRAVPKLKTKTKLKTTKIIFLSRICKMKNLLFAAKIISKLKTKIKFDIYGTLEDQQYWVKCQNILKSLPDNVRWEYKGIADSKKVIDIFSEYDIFLFPTLGENFGHVVFEALAAGCIPVISDQTPWTDLEDNKCGYIIPLSSEKRYRETLEMLCEMSDPNFAMLRENAHSYALKKYNESMKNTGYRRIFDNLIREQ